MQILILVLFAISAGTCGPSRIPACYVSPGSLDVCSGAFFARQIVSERLGHSSVRVKVADTYSHAIRGKDHAAT
jgi:hypothetical protein